MEKAFPLCALCVFSPADGGMKNPLSLTRKAKPGSSRVAGRLKRLVKNVV